jgi:hypothetical protein
MFIRDPDHVFLPIPDPGIEKASDPLRIRNTVKNRTNIMNFVAFQ